MSRFDGRNLVTNILSQFDIFWPKMVATPVTQKRENVKCSLNISCGISTFDFRSLRKERVPVNLAFTK